MPVYSGEFRTQAGGQPGPGVLIGFGPILPVEIGVPSALSKLLASQNKTIPAPMPGFALIDTGATRSCVDVNIISHLEIKPIGIVPLETPAGPSQHNLFPAKFNFPAIKFEFEFSSVVGVSLGQKSIGGKQIIALIGRDVLSRCLLVYNGPKASFSIAL